MGDLNTVLSYAQLMESLATTAAIVAGAWWFFVRRENVRKANIAHNITFAKAGKWVYVGVQVTIKNTGRRRIESMPREPGRLVRPANDSLFEGIGDIVVLEEVSPFLGETEISSQELSPEFNLQFLGIRSFPGKIFIEPDEEQTILFDFVIPRSSKTIKVYSHIDNTYNKDNGWNTSTIHHVRLEP